MAGVQYLVCGIEHKETGRRSRSGDVGVRWEDRIAHRLVAKILTSMQLRARSKLICICSIDPEHFSWKWDASESESGEYRPMSRNLDIGRTIVVSSVATRNDAPF